MRHAAAALCRSRNSRRWSTRWPTIRLAASSSDLLREDHPIYDQRGAATVVRIRGWILLALAAPGHRRVAPLRARRARCRPDPYLVAAAARALRSYPRPTPARAVRDARLRNIRYQTSRPFEHYGEYATRRRPNSGARARDAGLARPARARHSPRARALRARSRRPLRSCVVDVDRADRRDRRNGHTESAPPDCCGRRRGPPRLGPPRGPSWPEPIEPTLFEIRTASRPFDDFFRGIPPSWCSSTRAATTRRSVR